MRYRLSWLLLLAIGPISSATATKVFAEQSMVSKLESALELATSCLAAADRAGSDHLWFLLGAQEKLDQAELAKQIERLLGGLGNDGLARLVDPDRQSPATYRFGPKPWNQLVNLMRDSVRCAEGSSPSRELRMFVTETHGGYIQTHQVLAILWAQSVDCETPDSWQARLQELVDRVITELQASEPGLDLLAEQLAVVTLAGRVAALEEQWIERLLSAQQKDGCWTDPRTVVSMKYNGTTLVNESAEIDPLHTTSIAISALAHYWSSLVSLQVASP